MPSDYAWISELVLFIIGGGVGAGVTAWRKGGNEAESIAVKTLRGVIHELREELDRRELEIQSLRARVDVAAKHLEQLASEPPGHLA